MLDYSGLSYGHRHHQTTKDRVTKIFIIDSDPFVRQGMKKVIEKERGFRVILGAGSVEETLFMINYKIPDLAIIDLSLASEARALGSIKTLNNAFPGIKILVLSIQDADFFSERLFRAGAHGYLTKNTAPSAIIEAIRELMSGKQYLYAGNKGNLL